jgi:hypothetical protein
MSATDWLIFRRVETVRRHRDSQVGSVRKHVDYEVSDGSGEPINGATRIALLDEHYPDWRKEIVL